MSEPGHDESDRRHELQMAMRAAMEAVISRAIDNAYSTHTRQNRLRGERVPPLSSGFKDRVRDEIVAEVEGLDCYDGLVDGHAKTSRTIRELRAAIIGHLESDNAHSLRELRWALENSGVEPKKFDEPEG